MKTIPAKKSASNETPKTLLRLTKTVVKQLLETGSILLISIIVFSTLWFVHTQTDVFLKKTVLYIQSVQGSQNEPAHQPRPCGWIALFSFVASFGLVLEAKKWADDFGDTTVFIRH